ncbi:MAG: ComEA family DNA-binding protein [Acidimicrobiaceae bacterium]|nr:ComEA family DNA-binding protein [Acidimicrobiaceae bacterium]
MGRGEAVQQWADSVADRLGVGIWGFVAGVAAIIAAAVGGWWALASPDVAPAEEMLPRVVNAPAPVVAETSQTAESGGRIVVHVEGAVVLPGVHELAEGSRVHDAVDAADGLTAEADRSRINLAAQLADGQRVWVPAVGEPEPAVVDMAASGAGGAPAAPVNLNTADLATLETLPGIGPSIAAAIIGHRQQHGAFSRAEGLLEVPGIGRAKLEQLLLLVTV